MLSALLLYPFGKDYKIISVWLANAQNDSASRLGINFHLEMVATGLEISINGALFVHKCSLGCLFFQKKEKEKEKT